MDKWETQRYANILAFLTSEDYAERKKVLESVCQAFRGLKINWAIAMSCSLFFRGITDDFNDFDILIDIKDVEAFQETFEEIPGAKVNAYTIQKPAFSSPYYKEATIGQFHFDLIGDMRVDTFGRNYKYVLKETDVEKFTIDGGMTIPLAPVEANFLLYGMMVGWQARRIFKKELCYGYLKSRGVQNRDVFERVVDSQGCLTDELLEDIKTLLG